MNTDVQVSACVPVFQQGMYLRVCQVFSATNIVPINLNLKKIRKAGMCDGTGVTMAGRAAEL